MLPLQLLARERCLRNHSPGYPGLVPGGRGRFRSSFLSYKLDRFRHRDIDTGSMSKLYGTRMIVFQTKCHHREQ